MTRLIIKPIKFFILLCLILFIGNEVYTKESNVEDYEVYVNEIISSFAKEMKDEFGLLCIGDSGRMPNDVEEIGIMFVVYQKGTIEKARELEVKCIQRLLSHINNHEKIRPYLREHPFKSDRVGISIAFRNKNSPRSTDGSVVLVFLAKNKIFYDKAEIRMEKPLPITNMTEYELEFDDKEQPIEKLITIHEEPYEEALKIVESQR